MSGEPQRPERHAAANDKETDVRDEELRVTGEAVTSLDKDTHKVRDAGDAEQGSGQEQIRFHLAPPLSNPQTQLRLCLTQA
jgi:hypothetical protein